MIAADADVLADHDSMTERLEPADAFPEGLVIERAASSVGLGVLEGWVAVDQAAGCRWWSGEKVSREELDVEVLQAVECSQ